MDYKSSRYFLIFFIAVSAAFFVGTLVVTIPSAGDVYVSPDETANAFFTRRFSKTGLFSVSDSLNSELGDAFHPRSTIARGGLLMPGSFLGLPALYGAIIFVFGDWILPLLTPIIAIFSALAFRRVLSVFFSQKVSDVSTILFLMHPAIWYYSSRSLMHNVLFVSLLIFAAYFFFFQNPAPKTQNLLISGFLIGLSLFVRASEIFWVFAIVFLLALFQAKKIGKKKIAVFFIGIFVGLLPFFYFNAVTYGHPLTTGYTSEVLTEGFIAQEQATQLTILFPFGINVRSVANHVSNYGVILFWWLSVLALVGIPIVFSRFRNFVFLFIAISIWLGLWYGSWTLFDNPDSTQITIANSYVRYWLPIFVLSIPFVSEAIVWISDKGRTRFARSLFLSSIIVLVIGLNVRIVFFEGQDSLTKVSDELLESRQIKKEVLAITTPDSVIVVDRGDKLFFPERRVRYPLRSEFTYSLMPKIASTTPLFYYGITFPQSDLDYLNNSKLKNLGLQIEPIQTFNEETLYKIFIP
ncbi:glycosyltransferase family 39 protein [Candidatus Uhrbacteria bacterium]|nr:glycosyltransferase family 39 protein [Candidatus Uhrbacteria bacterium]